jgi:hypothetical protein
LLVNTRWKDGFSILYLNNDGIIYKHTVQRVMTQHDEDKELAKDKNLKDVRPNLDVGPSI